MLFFAAREAVRNAASHARQSEVEQPLGLSIRLGLAGGLELLVEDNGCGIAETSHEPSGGQGLALHSTMMAVIGGSMAVESEPGKYTRVRLFLPFAK